MSEQSFVEIANRFGEDLRQVSDLMKEHYDGKYLIKNFKKATKPKESVSIGKVWAICDHFEMQDEKPVLAHVLKQACGVDRKQLRKWVRDGRLNEFNVTNPGGQMEKAYGRPKEKPAIKPGIYIEHDVMKIPAVSNKSIPEQIYDAAVNLGVSPELPNAVAEQEHVEAPDHKRNHRGHRH